MILVIALDYQDLHWTKVHIENPQNLNGKDNALEVFVHSYNLANNNTVKEVRLAQNPK